jgi:hypothetical protein
LPAQLYAHQFIQEVPVPRKVPAAGTELNHATLSIGAKKASDIEKMLNFEISNCTVKLM